MREYAVPGGPPSPYTRLTDALVAHARDHPQRVAAAYRLPGAGTWVDVTTAELHEAVADVARGLLAQGVEHGDRVLLLSSTRLEWTVVDYAVWWVGAVTVPLYPTASVEQVATVVQDSGARAAVVENADLAAVVAEAAPDLPIWLVDEGSATGPAKALAGLRAATDAVTEPELEQRRTAVGPEDVATLIYTSGTTGHPKGCVLTHGNFLAEIDGAADGLEVLFEDEDAATLLVLPLAHVFARLLQVAAVSRGVRLGYSTDVRRLVDDLREFRPTFLLGVPRLFERIFTVLSQRAASDGRGRRFDRATDLAIAYSEALEAGSTGPVLASRHRVMERLVYRGLRDSLGGRCRYVISGGAPVGDHLAHFYRGIGIPVLEGYGLTETTGATTTSVPDAIRVGSAGRPIPGAAVRVEDDGELLVRGPHVMRGYWQDPAATAEVLDEDGWLHTGDLAEIDGEGFVRITGRKKEIIVTAGGKNVAPAQLEQRVRAHPLVAHCMVVGDGRPYVGALVTLDRETSRQWAEERGKNHADLPHDPEVRRAVQTAVDEANGAVSQAESIRRFVVLPGEWTEEGGELTASLKLRRGVIARRHRAEIDALYDA